MVSPGARAQTAQGLIDQLFGVSTEQRDGGIDVTATTSVEQFLRAYPSRIAFTFTNLGANPVFIWSDQGVATTKGLRAGPNGGSVVLKYDEDFSRVTFPWFMLSSGGSSSVAIMEVLIGS